MKKRTSLLVLIACTFLFTNVSAIVGETNKVLINEFVVDPQSDWDSSGSVGASDEWFELHNPRASSVIIDGWTIRFIDTSTEAVLNGTIPAGGYLTFINPPGNQPNDGRIELYDGLNNLVDSVSYGDYDDGNISDNAPEGSATTAFNECIARFPNGADSGVDRNDFIKTLCTYNSPNNFSLVPITITNLQTKPTCALHTDNITVAANIIGTIAQVKILLNATGTIQEIILPGNYAGIYTYTINPSETIGGTTVEWRFAVEDVMGDVTYGETGSSRIYFVTSLRVFPPVADGRNGWYVTEPQFELSNPDAHNINYYWNGLYYTYSFPFGLEGAPNDGNITGGTLVLRYKSNYSVPQCQEPEKQFIGRFDFRDPRIENLNPRPDSITFNQEPFVIRAHLDEVYQGNSGINVSSVVMEIDGSAVPIVVNASGLDADVMFIGTIPDGEHEATIYMEDYAGRSSSTTWQFELIPPIELDMSVNLPAEGMYMDRRLQFNITLTRAAEKLSYINYADSNPVQKILCKNCNGFGNIKAIFKSLRDGENLLTFRAEDNGEVIEESVHLIIDSKSPKIINTLPRSGLASGTFGIEFEEENPSLLQIIYGNSKIGFRSHDLNISSDCQKNTRYSCTTSIDILDYDGTQIEYHFLLEDLAGNSQISPTRKMNVDILPPVINSFDFRIEGKQATFSLEVEEPYLDKITFIDFNDANPREIRLCNALQNKLCIKRVSLKEGDHNITVIVRDTAGNTAEASALFFTDSLAPKIKQTKPTRGLSSGEFVVTYEETNPQEMYLIYGNLSERRFAPVNLDDCVEDRKSRVCTVSVNLSEFEGQSVSYQFNLTDKVGNLAESRSYTLTVDTLAPVITEFNYTINNRELSFTIGVEDANFDEVLYLDREEVKPQSRILCSKLDKSFCQKTKRFSLGHHSLDIIAKDKAGNEAIVVSGLSFSI